jgi:hypothetical protein
MRFGLQPSCIMSILIFICTPLPPEVHAVPPELLEGLPDGSQNRIKGINFNFRNKIPRAGESRSITLSHQFIHICPTLPVRG